MNHLVTCPIILVQFRITLRCYGNWSVRVIQGTLTSLLCPQVDVCQCASHDDTASPGAGQGATLRPRGRLQHRECLQCYQNRWVWGRRSRILVKNRWVHGSSSGLLTVTDTIGEIQMLSMFLNNWHWLVGSVPVNRDVKKSVSSSPNRSQRWPLPTTVAPSTGCTTTVLPSSD